VILQTIIGIAYLHKTFNGRVHIILGNRDINKFRLAYEFNLPGEQLPEKDDEVWDDWIKITKDFVKLQSDKTNLFKLIMNSSMGAMNAGDDSEKIHPNITVDDSIEWLLAVFDPSFIIDTVPEFVDYVNTTGVVNDSNRNLFQNL